MARDKTPEEKMREAGRILGTTIQSIRSPEERSKIGQMGGSRVSDLVEKGEKWEEEHEGGKGRKR